MAGTLYEIDVRYNIIGSGNVINNFNTIASGAQKAEKSILGLGSAFNKLAGFITVRKILQEAKSAFVDFNSEMEQVKIGMATMIGAIYDPGQKKGLDLFGLATATRDELAKFSRAAPGGMQDYFKGFTTLSAGLSNAKVTLKEMTTMSEHLTAASMVRGLGGEVLLQQLNRSFMAEKGIRRTSSELIKFLTIGGVKYEDYLSMSLEKRAKKAEAIATSPAFRDALISQAKTWESVWDSAKNSISYALGEAGTPLFESLKGAISKFNTWFDANQAKIHVWAKEFGAFIEQGFNTMLEAVKYLIAHKEEILLIGKAYVGARIVGGVQSTLGGMAAAGGGGLLAAGGLRAAGSALVAGGFVSVVIAATLGALGLTYGMIKHRNDEKTYGESLVGRGLATMFGPTSKMKQGMYDEEQQAQSVRFNAGLETAQSLTGLPGGANRLGGEMIAANADAISVMRENNALTLNKEGSLFFDKAIYEETAKANGISQKAMEMQEEKLGAIVGFFNLYKLGSKIFSPDPGATGKSAGTANTTVNNYNQIQVTTGDPDRFAAQFMELMQKTTTRSLRGGRR